MAILKRIVRDAFGNDPDWVTFESPFYSHDESKNYSWIFAKPKLCNMREAGWKIHLSSSRKNIEILLETITPELRRLKVHFKCVSSVAFVHYLNDGRGGIGSVGKLVTLYPNDDSHFQEIIEALYPLTQAFRGPRVYTDKRYKDSNVLFYRWGAIVPQYAQTIFGDIVPLVTKPDGKQKIDEYSYASSETHDIEDPVVDQRLQPKGSRVFDQRYLEVCAIHLGAHSKVILAIDLIQKRRCVIKIGYDASELDLDGNPSAERIKRERKILMKLSGKAKVPQVYDSFVVNNDSSYCLVMEDLAGISLEKITENLVTLGRPPYPKHVLPLAIKIVESVADLHKAGIIHGDIKPSNFILVSDEVLILDFESASDVFAKEFVYALGSPGFASANRRKAGEPNYKDDVYSLGAFLYYLFAGVNPRNIQIDSYQEYLNPQKINPLISEGLFQILQKALDRNEDKRYESASEMVRDLRNVKLGTSNDHSRNLDHSYYEIMSSSPHAAEELSRMLLTRYFDSSREGCGFALSSLGQQKILDLRGTAGVLLSLVDVFAHYGCSREFRNKVTKIKQSIISGQALEYNELPGLYVGSAGTSLSIFLYGYFLGDQESLIYAQNTIVNIALSANEHPSPDIVNGLAGLLRALIIMHMICPCIEVANAIDSISTRLVDTCLELNQLRCFWKTVNPKSYKGRIEYDQTLRTDYAHGSAGIVDALLDYAIIFKCEEEVKHIINDAVHFFMANKTRLDDICLWPSSTSENGNIAFGRNFWCSSGGIIRFLLRSHKYGFAELDDVFLNDAALSLISSARATLPIQCHGLVGNAELLYDIYQLSGEKAHLTFAHEIHQLVDTWTRVVMREAPIKSVGFRATSWLEGIPGIISFYNRYHKGISSSHILSVENFQERAGHRA
ncbi:MAG: hypothetical protein H6657_14840 [Ardenticatenaceae bacterium]|nr:hypothetical protein [Ardenticatenaceae bacterium]